MATAASIRDKLFAAVNRPEIGVTATFQSETSYTHDRSTGEVTVGETAVDVVVSPPFRKDRIGKDSSPVAEEFVFLPAKNLTFSPVLGMRIEHPKGSGRQFQLTDIERHSLADGSGAETVIGYSLGIGE